MVSYDLQDHLYNQAQTCGREAGAFRSARHNLEYRLGDIMQVLNLQLSQYKKVQILALNALFTSFASTKIQILTLNATAADEPVAPPQFTSFTSTKSTNTDAEYAADEPVAPARGRLDSSRHSASRRLGATSLPTSLHTRLQGAACSRRYPCQHSDGALLGRHFAPQVRPHERRARCLWHRPRRLWRRASCSSPPKLANSSSRSCPPSMAPEQACSRWRS